MLACACTGLVHLNGCPALNYIGQLGDGQLGGQTIWEGVRAGALLGATKATQKDYAGPLQSVPEVDRLSAAAITIRTRIMRLREIRKTYLAYQADRVAEEDHHSVRDVACDIELTDYEILGLEFALRAMGKDVQK